MQLAADGKQFSTNVMNVINVINECGDVEMCRELLFRTESAEADEVRNLTESIASRTRPNFHISKFSHFHIHSSRSLFQLVPTCTTYKIRSLTSSPILPWPKNSPSMENQFIKPARILMAIALIVFGVQHFIYRDFLPKLEPLPAGVPGRTALAYIFGSIIILSALGIATGIMDRLAAVVIATICLTSVVFFHLPLLANNLHDPDKWACICEELAIGSTILVLAGMLPGKTEDKNAKVVRAGQIFFSITLIIFGIQHFMYAEFIATLIPGWIPFHIFWAYFVGVVFFSVAASIIFKRKTQLALTLLAAMFLFWVVFLHIPRVIDKPDNMDGWTSAAVALAMCAGSLVVARSVPGEQVTVHALQRQSFH